MKKRLVRKVFGWSIGAGGAPMSVVSYAPCAVTSRDGATLYSGHIDGALRVWDARTGAHLDSWSDTHAKVTLSALALTGDGALLVCAAGPHVAVRELPSGKLRANLSGFRGDALSLALTPGDDVVVGSRAECAAVLSLDGSLRCEVSTGDAVRSVSVSPRGDEFATGGLSQLAAITRWSLRDGAKLGALGANREHAPSKIAYSHDGEALFAGYPSAGMTPPTLVAWDLARSAPRWERGMACALLDLALVDGGQRIITAHHDGAIRVWDSATGTPRFTLDPREIGTGYALPPTCLAAHGDTLFAGASGARFVRLARQGSVLSLDDPPRVAPHEGGTRALAFAGDRSLVSLGAKGDFARWDVNLLEAPLRASIDGVSAMLGERSSVLLRTANGLVRANGRTLKTHALRAPTVFEEPETLPSLARGDAPTLALPDGARALAATPAAVLLVDRATGETLATLEGLAGVATALAVSPSGRLVAASDGDTILLWRPPA